MGPVANPPSLPLHIIQALFSARVIYCVPPMSKVDRLSIVNRDVLCCLLHGLLCCVYYTINKTNQHIFVFLSRRPIPIVLRRRL